MAATAHGTLTANQVTTVAVDWTKTGVVVVNVAQTGVIWVRLDGVTPVPGAAGTYAVYGSRDFPLRRDSAMETATVKMISDANRAYTVEAIG